MRRADARGDAALDAAQRELTEGRGADHVDPHRRRRGRAARAAAARVRDGGTLHYFAGGAGDSLPLPLETLYHRELTLTATYSSSPADLAEAFALLAGGPASAVDAPDQPPVPLGRLAATASS